MWGYRPVDRVDAGRCVVIEMAEIHVGPVNDGCLRVLQTALGWIRLYSSTGWGVPAPNWVPPAPKP